MATPALSFIFGGDTGETPESIKRKRDLAMAIMGASAAPKNIGEGLNALGSGIVAGVMNRRANKAESAGRSAADDLFNRIIGQAPDVSASSMLSPGIKPASTGTSAATGAAASVNVDPSIRDGIAQTASALGVDPVDLATAISYETAGTFDPTKAGPTTKWGKHRGLIQFGEPQAQQYGVNWNDPVGSQLGENGAVAKYLRSAGVKPGMGLLDIYSAINAGGVGRYNASDAAAGGAPGTVHDKVENQMAGHRAKALALFGGQGQEVASLDPSIGMSPQTAAGAVNAMAAGGGAVIADESQYSPEDRARLAALRGPAPSSVPYSGPGARIDTPMPVYDDKGFRMEPAGQQPTPSLSDEVAAFEQTPEYQAQFPGMSAQPPQQSAIPAQFQGSQQLANAQGGMMPALMGGAPASPEQVAQAQAMGQQQQPQPQQQAPQGPDQMMLLQALSNPFLSEEQRAVIQTLYQQKVQEQEAAREQQIWMQRQQYEAEQKRNDPAYQIGLEKSRIELEDAKKPKQQPLVNAGDGQVYDPNSKQWLTPPNGSRKPPQVVELFDEATGQPYKATWNPETQEYERVGGVKARSGMQLTTNPDGTVTLTEGAIGGLPKLTEAEGRNSGFYGRGVESHKILNDLESEGTSLWNNTVGNVPIAGNYLRSEDAQRYDQAKRDYINAVLRRESGAVISPEEFKNAEQQYFPQPGDGPEVIEQKRKNRETTIQGLKISAGQGAAFAVPSEQPSQQKRGPVSIGGYTIEEVD